MPNPGEPPSYDSIKKYKFNSYKEKMRKILNGIDDVSLKLKDKKNLLLQLQIMVDKHEPRKTV